MCGAIYWCESIWLLSFSACVLCQFFVDVLTDHGYQLKSGESDKLQSSLDCLILEISNDYYEEFQGEPILDQCVAAILDIFYKENVTEGLIQRSATALFWLIHYQNSLCSLIRRKDFNMICSRFEVVELSDVNKTRIATELINVSRRIHSIRIIF